VIIIYSHSEPLVVYSITAFLQRKEHIVEIVIFKKKICSEITQINHSINPKLQCWNGGYIDFFSELTQIF
jgi:hypothetical protein